jgi:hypothetical protein
MAPPAPEVDPAHHGPCAPGSGASDRSPHPAAVGAACRATTGDTPATACPDACRDPGAAAGGHVRPCGREGCRCGRGVGPSLGGSHRGRTGSNPAAGARSPAGAFAARPVGAAAGRGGAAEPGRSRGCGARRAVGGSASAGRSMEGDGALPLPGPTSLGYVAPGRFRRRRGGDLRQRTRARVHTSTVAHSFHGMIHGYRPAPCVPT